MILLQTHLNIVILEERPVRRNESNHTSNSPKICHSERSRRALSTWNLEFKNIVI